MGWGNATPGNISNPTNVQWNNALSPVSDRTNYNYPNRIYNNNMNINQNSPFVVHK